MIRQSGNDLVEGDKNEFVTANFFYVTHKYLARPLVVTKKAGRQEAICFYIICSSPSQPVIASLSEPLSVIISELTD